MGFPELVLNQKSAHYSPHYRENKSASQTMSKAKWTQLSRQSYVFYTAPGRKGRNTVLTHFSLFGSKKGHRAV